MINTGRMRRIAKNTQTKVVQSNAWFPSIVPQNEYAIIESFEKLNIGEKIFYMKLIKVFLISGALSGKMLPLRIVENNKSFTYYRAG